MRRLGLVAALIATLSLVLVACGTTVSFETPDGFAQFSDERQPRAISPEGVVLRMRTVENRPVQDLDFWSEALERQMIDSGYLPLEKGEFATSGFDGTWFEWLAPLNDADWVYLTALAVVEDAIVIAEAAGPYDLYTERRADLLDSLSTIAVER